MRLRPMRRMMHGIDVLWETRPGIAMLGIMVIAIIAAGISKGVIPGGLKKYKALPESMQYIVIGLSCVILLLLVMLFAAIWGAGEGWRSW